MTLRSGSLFTGTTALDLAAHTVLDAQPVWFVDNDPAAARLLAHHHTGVPNHGDITTIDWDLVEPVDVLTGGFPYQDISNAGRREGITGARSALWTHYAHAIGTLRPQYVLVENVAVLLVRGFDTVAADLARLGYRFAWCVLGAADVGACHRRNRIFILAVAEDADGATRGERRFTAPGEAERGRPRADAGGRGQAPATDAAREHERPVATGDRRAQPEKAARNRGAPAAHLDWGVYTPAIRRWAAILGRPAPAPTVPGHRGGHVLNPALTEWMMGLPEGWITTVPGLTRNQQLKLVGNGVVPHQATAAYRHLFDVLNQDTEAAA